MIKTKRSFLRRKKRDIRLRKRYKDGYFEVYHANGYLEFLKYPTKIELREIYSRMNMSEYMIEQLTSIAEVDKKEE